MATTDLKIRVVNTAKSTLKCLLFQKDLTINVENYKVGAWQAQPIASGAQYDTILPFAIQVQGRNNFDKGTYRTGIKAAEYNDQWELYDVNEAMDIRKAGQAAGNNTINIKNTYEDKFKVAVALKNGSPLFGCDLRPGLNLNFAVKPKLYAAVNESYKKGDLFEYSTFTDEIEIAFEGKTFVLITIKESDAGKITIAYEFQANAPADFETVAVEASNEVYLCTTPSSK